MESKSDSENDFKNSKAYFLLKEFILKINNSIKTEKQIPIDSNSILFRIKEIVLNTPLSEIKGRFANPAMVTIIEEVEKITNNEYLRNSFGNKIRMDFGTGHELNFLCFLYSEFDRVNRDKENTEHKGSEDKQSLTYAHISNILKEYFSIVRIYVAKFNVEAAGSRGCWSIDDYLLLPYLFGSAENFNDPRRITEIFSGMFRNEYENNRSPMLRDLCKLPWPSINVGMFEMYVAEVMGRRVVTQHFIYSESLPY